MPETDAQRLERIRQRGRVGKADLTWLWTKTAQALAQALAQAADAQELRAALEDAGNQHCGWCFLSPFDKCERSECPGAPARRVLERKP